ncbi:MAG: AraC family transcriptional regulator [Gemmatimonadota bacterium]|nr:AraC family transcriptional regulator [Gemmatimonadota bacterium]
MVQHRHAHAETTITLVLAGSLRETVGSTQEVARALSVVLKPGDTEHANRFGDRGARTLQIGLTECEASEVREWEPSMRTWRWTHTGPAVPAFLRLFALLRGRPREDALIARAVADVLASLRDVPDDSRHAPPMWLRQVREEIDDIGSSVRVRNLAAGAGVHPVYLARQFRRFFGSSVVSYLQRQRVMRAAELIASSSMPLSAVAFQAGFADQSHLNRSFRAGTGLTPGVYAGFIRSRLAEAHR